MTTRSTAPPSIAIARPPALAPAAIGIAVWAAGLALLPAPLAARILLLAPLVIAPRLLGVVPSRPFVAAIAGWPALGAALALVASFAAPAGPIAAALSTPWLVVCGVAAAAAVVHAIPRLPRLLHPEHAASLGLDVALGFLAVGSAFTLADRLGVQPMGFSPAIILLTATHFHFAAFGLLTLVSLEAAQRPWLRGPVLALMAGVPLTALGFIVPSNAAGAAGAVLVAAAGIAFAVALVTDRRGGLPRAARLLAGTALLVAMPMAIAWSVAILVGARFLDLDAMVRTHGALNATAVLLATMAAGRPR